MKKDQKAMTLIDKEQYINKTSKRCYASGKVKRGQILDEVCAIFDISRSYAIRRLNTGYKRHKNRPGKASQYGSSEFVKALKQIWFASQWSCGKLLKASIPLLLPHLERRHQEGVSQEVKEPALPAALHMWANLYKSEIKRWGTAHP